jgi:hypothetical protein
VPVPRRRQPHLSFVDIDAMPLFVKDGTLYNCRLVVWCVGHLPLRRTGSHAEESERREELHPEDFAVRRFKAGPVCVPETRVEPRPIEARKGYP